MRLQLVASISSPKLFEKESRYALRQTTFINGQSSVTNQDTVQVARRSVAASGKFQSSDSAPVSVPSSSSCTATEMVMRHAVKELITDVSDDAGFSDDESRTSWRRER
jgi:hypothetical protein